MKTIERKRTRTSNQKGIIGYAILWWLGVPVSLLIIFALLRGG